MFLPPVLSVWMCLFQQNEIIPYTMLCNLLFSVSEPHVSISVNSGTDTQAGLRLHDRPQILYRRCPAGPHTEIDCCVQVPCSSAHSLSHDHVLERMGQLVCRMFHLLDLSACFQFCFFGSIITKFFCLNGII